MSLRKKLKDFIAPIEEEEVLELDEEESKRLSDYEQPQNKALNKTSLDTKMVLFEPRSFDEAEEVGVVVEELRDDHVGARVHLAFQVQQIGGQVGRLDVLFRVAGHGDAEASLVQLPLEAANMTHQFVGVGVPIGGRHETGFTLGRIPA